MTLHLSPAMLEAAYELLRTTPPFRGWRLPSADEIGFAVSRSHNDAGACEADGDGYLITISDHLNGHSQSLLVTMGHEMIHLHQFLRRSDTSNTAHNAEFKRLAERVCLLHGFDAKAF